MSSIAVKFCPAGSVSIGLGSLESRTGMKKSSVLQLLTKHPLSHQVPSSWNVLSAKLCLSSSPLRPCTVIQYTSSPSMYSIFVTFLSLLESYLFCKCSLNTLSSL